jgi:hypothetical protein
MERTKVCKYCEREIVAAYFGWVDPQATGDDSIWRETCDANTEDFAARHEPKH